VPAFALNFYSPVVEAQLRSHRKSATIRLGDKSRKYQKGMVIAVLCGARFSPRQHVFDAVIDKVDVKTIAELSPNEIEHDNPEIRHTEELCRFLGQLYNRDVTTSDTVTVIRFSAIKPSYGFSDRGGNHVSPTSPLLPREASPRALRLPAGQAGLRRHPPALRPTLNPAMSLKPTSLGLTKEHGSIRPVPWRKTPARGHRSLRTSRLPDIRLTTLLQMPSVT
jgi:hypothetical protein